MLAPVPPAETVVAKRGLFVAVVAAGAVKGWRSEAMAPESGSIAESAADFLGQASISPVRISSLPLSICSTSKLSQPGMLLVELSGLPLTVRISSSWPTGRDADTFGLVVVIVKLLVFVKKL